MLRGYRKLKVGMLLFCNEDKEQMTDNYCPPSILYCPLLSSIIFFLLEKRPCES